jgi:hypothetical protein
METLVLCGVKMPAKMTRTLPTADAVFGRFSLLLLLADACIVGFGVGGKGGYGFLGGV